MLQNKLQVFCCPFFRTLSNIPILEKKKKKNEGCMEVRQQIKKDLQFNRRTCIEWKSKNIYTGLREELH